MSVIHKNMTGLISPDSASASSVDELPDLPSDNGDLGDGGMMWSYLYENKINGVPVADEDRGLKIDNEFTILNAFDVRRKPHSLLLYMTPDDEESKRKYDAVIADAYEGKVQIIEENKDFDAAHSRYVVWLRYDEICYALNPRYYYLREE